MADKIVTSTDYWFELGLPLWAEALPQNIISAREKEFLQAMHSKVEKLFYETKYGDYPERLQSLSNILTELDFLIEDLK